MDTWQKGNLKYSRKQMQLFKDIGNTTTLSMISMPSHGGTDEDEIALDGEVG